jgi:uncharacterized protein YjiS (DUF1127 family)
VVETIFEFFKSIDKSRKENRLSRETFKELSKLTDKELGDIGLSRGDVWYVSYKGLSND